MKKVLPSSRRKKRTTPARANSNTMGDVVNTFADDFEAPAGQDVVRAPPAPHSKREEPEHKVFFPEKSALSRRHKLFRFSAADEALPRFSLPRHPSPPSSLARTSSATGPSSRAAQAAAAVPKKPKRNAALRSATKSPSRCAARLRKTARVPGTYNRTPRSSATHWAPGCAVREWSSRWRRCARARQVRSSCVRATSRRGSRTPKKSPSSSRRSTKTCF
jgi:hypothetical protein